ncbi:glutathione S-transferase [Altererythrobacter aurantiacus]|uniref:Glutathione S-transferase n=1 Tax=Parapontixanthobacter aurantiacus TaxID=1463599 RepID=A0A844ZCV1_9SPHN|nr:glutathione S-transferase [Parapontixanthobacter aurantiacus]MXO84740.1 glutathione S-transferase [Parapontixanthobacter aurantiacus]
MAEPVLYSFRRCPYAMRARMALHVSGIEPDFREVVLRDKPHALLEVSPKGTVPVLVLPDGEVLEESLDIMKWSLTQNDPEDWLARKDDALIEANDGPFKHHLDRYKYETRHDSDPVEHRRAATEILARLEERLAQQPYLSGDRRGFTDIAIMPFVRQFAHADREWFFAQEWGHLIRWLEEIKASALFKGIMVKREQWKPASA